MMSNAPVPLVTWDDFVNLPDDDRRELIDGQLVETEVPTETHEHIVAALIFHLYQWAASRGGLVRASGYKMKVSEARGVMPDVQVYLPSNKSKRTNLGLVDGHPDLAVEIISQSSRRYDRVVKLGYYASIGVPEYWIVDPFDRSLERLLLRDGGYLIAGTAMDDDTFAPASFEGLTIPLSTLWSFPTPE